MPPQLQAVIDQLRALLAGPERPRRGGGLGAAGPVAARLVAARPRGGGDAETVKELRATQNQLRLARGDAVQANRDHAAELARLNKELDNLGAKVGGRELPRSPSGASARWPPRSACHRGRDAHR
jgi:hypothetical protein